VSSGLETLSTPLEVSEPLEFRALLGAQEQRALIAAPEGDPEEAEQDEDEDAGDEDEDDDEEDADGEEKA
jgi:hypothetical protein